MLHGKEPSTWLAYNLRNLLMLEYSFIQLFIWWMRKMNYKKVRFFFFQMDQPQVWLLMLLLLLVMVMMCEYACPTVWSLCVYVNWGNKDNIFTFLFFTVFSFLTFWSTICIITKISACEIRPTISLECSQLPDLARSFHLFTTFNEHFSWTETEGWQ